MNHYHIIFVGTFTYKLHHSHACVVYCNLKSTYIESKKLTSCFYLIPKVPRVNDTVIGDPLYTVPINSIGIDEFGISRGALCFEIHGDDDKYLNLVSDVCTSVNAHYSKLNEFLNIVDGISVRAVDDTGRCRNIAVELEGCVASIDGTEIGDHINEDGINVRKYEKRTRVSVPNCNGTISLVMWAICQTNILENPFTEETYQADMIKFIITRGLALNESSHGLLGQ